MGVTGRLRRATIRNPTAVRGTRPRTRSIPPGFRQEAQMSRHPFRFVLVVPVVAAALAGFAVGAVATRSVEAQAPAAQSAAGGARTSWFFYTVRWGYQDEFLDLFQKNHYPVLKEQVRSGRLTAIKTYVPTNHGDGRADWTFAVALTFRDAAAMTGPSPDAEIARRLYPDLATFRAEEQRRFEILDAHWDVPLNEIDLDARVLVGR